MRTVQQAGQAHDVWLDFIGLPRKDGCRHVHPQGVDGATSTAQEHVDDVLPQVVDIAFDRSWQDTPRSLA
jgi:hypothetical protein